MITLPAKAWDRITDIDSVQFFGGGNVLKIYAVDDDSCVIFVGSQAGIFGFKAFVVDGASLARTFYQTTYNPNQPNITKIIPFGGGFFVVFMDDGSVYTFQAVNLKLNNPSPILIAGNPVVPATACQAILSKIYYDNVNQVVGFGYYNPFNGSIFASTWNVYRGGVDLIAEGFPGFWSLGVDSWDHTAQLAASGINTILSNGISTNFAVNPSWTVYRQAFTILPGADQQGCYKTVKTTNDCGTQPYPGYVLTNCTPTNPQTATWELDEPNGSGVYTGFSLQFATGLTGIPAGNIVPCDCNISRFTAFVPLFTNYGVHVFGDNGVWIYLPYADGGGGQSAVTKKHVFVLVDFQGTTLGVIDVPAGNPWFQNGYSVNRQARTLVNNSRPISVTGAFKA
jgi:hypothetical protein